MNIHPEFHRFLHRHDKEKLLGQTWHRRLALRSLRLRQIHHRQCRRTRPPQQGRFTTILDGDNLRTGLNSNLGFTDQDRLENIRRIAETAKIFASQGIITLVSAITPRGELRDLARGLLGADLFEVYVKASYETCEKRDVKGLYAKAARGEIRHFTGKDGSFEPPQNPDLVLNTETSTVEDAAFELLEAIRERIALQRRSRNRVSGALSMRAHAKAPPISPDSHSVSCTIGQPHRGRAPSRFTLSGR